MSGIYGFSLPCASEEDLIDSLGGLNYWTRIYGRDGHGEKRLGSHALGCFVEHFSDRFPAGGPVLERQGRFAVVDALLYNREELFDGLALDTDAAISDEELLLRWLEEKGPEAMTAVNGDFAGAVYDPESREWTLFRDHMGVRPLFYYLDGARFAFSTDLIALASLPAADLSFDEDYMYANFIGANRLTVQGTDFAHIRCIRPAAVTRVRPVDNGFDVTEQIYWRPRQKRIRLGSHEAYCAELRRLVTDAVHRRCDAIPGILGAELSGGLDSSVIDILLTRHGRQGRFYSWSRDPEILPIVDPNDERNIVLDICRREGIDVRFRLPSDMRPFKARGANLIPPYLDTPIISAGSSWLHSQGARVVFTGHGGDEGISHRGHRFELFYNREYLTYFKYYYNGLKGRPLRLLRAIRAGLLDARDRYREIREYLSRIPEHTTFIRPDFARRAGERFRPRIFSFNFAPHIFVEQGGTRPRMDNTAFQGALNGVRYLFPYVDYRVMDFALSIPRREFVGESRTRVVFRDAFHDLLPDVLHGEVQKLTVSNMQLPDNPNQKADHYKLVDMLVDNLDPELWQEYMDLDELRRVLRSSEGKIGGIGSIDALKSYIIRCDHVQDVRKLAGNWREFDEQDKTV